MSHGPQFNFGCIDKGKGERDCVSQVNALKFFECHELSVKHFTIQSVTLMIKTKNISFIVSMIGILVFFIPANLWATQAHSGAEGIVVHQLGHIFFGVSMGMFVYWLGKGRILSYPGWRYILMFAVLLVIWNLDVITMHFLDEQTEMVRMIKHGSWTVDINTQSGSSGLALFYYLGKMDHLLCVPALFFLYQGLKNILKSLDKDRERT